MLKRITFLTLFLAIILMLPKISEAQIIKTTGSTSKSSSQLVYYYAQDEFGDAVIQITNTNDTEGVWIHVQLFRSFDVTDDPDDADLNKVICDERNFVDFLTPNDTHIYDLDADMFPKNDGETATAGGEATSIVDTDDTLGFIVITPVVSEADLTAISFQHLYGLTVGDDEDDDDIDLLLNAMGRDAVDFTTGAIVPDGTPLDGTTNGFVVIQPSELFFMHGSDDTDTSENETDIVGIAFNDVYGPAGLLGYAVTPGVVSWTPFLFDYIENPTSCGNREVSCFLSVGLNETLQQYNEELRPTQTGDDLLCAGTETPEYPIAGGTLGVNDGFEPEFFGWTRIFISGLDSFENHLGVFLNSDIEALTWMYAN